MPLHLDPAFNGVKEKPDGISIWRIEKMQVVALDRNKYGKFYSGDSYILLYKDRRNHEYNVHFWLGKETSQDEAGAAAIKSVELDDALGGAPVQYREVQEHESRRFLSYFKCGVEYLTGGVASGFRKAVKSTDGIRRLLHVKGRRQPRISEVPLSVSSMNQGDCFILDLGNEMYCWEGPLASRHEKLKATEFMHKVNEDERAGKVKTFNIVAGNPEDPDSVAFFQAVGGEESSVKPAVDDSDAQHDKETPPVSLYKVTDSGGTDKVVMTKVASGSLDRKQLDTKDCFIVDTEEVIYVWVGKQASNKERKSAMPKAEGFLKAKGHPDHKQIVRVLESAETVMFQYAFAKWPYPVAKSMMPGAQKSSSRKEVKSFDVQSMYSMKNEEQNMPDEARGKVVVTRVEDYALVEWPTSRYGIFFQGDSYVVWYSYIEKNKEKHILYFWLGLDSTPDEQVAAAMLTAQWDNKKLDGEATQHRVVQGQEPEHFLRIFKGKLVVKFGGRSKGQKTLTEAEEQGGQIHLYRVRGTNEFNVRCTQVELKAGSLNSNDAFILVTPVHTYVWCGKGASGDEREFAKLATKTIYVTERSFTLVLEGSESPEFWKTLGGKTEYMSVKELEEKIPMRPPRLFMCSNDKGYFYAEEILHFTQNDLEEDDVMILDTNANVFLWLGKDCNATEKKEGLITLQKYVDKDQTRQKDNLKVNTIVVKQGFEPMNFKAWFPTWNDKKWEEERLKNQGSEVDGVRSASEVLADYSKKHSYEVLKNDPPPEVVITEKEKYLEDSEFEKVFGMTREAFNHMPVWKRGQLKKKVDLF